MDRETRLSEVLRALRKLKFTALPRRGGARRFSGFLGLHKGALKIELLLADLEFTSYPVITLTERPSFLPAMMPHVDALGNLCYFASGTVVLDRYNPAGAIALCIKQATDVLNDIGANPKAAFEAAQDEYLAFWSIGQSPLARQVLVGEINPSQKEALYFRIGDDKDKAPIWMISQEPEEVQGIAQALKGGVFNLTTAICWIFDTNKKPHVPATGLPKTIGDLFSWLKHWDEETYKKLNSRLERDKDYLKGKSTILVFKNSYGWLGALIRHDDVHRQALRRSPAKYKQYLHTKGQKTKIIRLALDEVGASFIHSRNLAHPDLRDKKITVVGCGSIGSYLAQGLVRLGAGSGPRGLLTLIDCESLNPENLGRHYLGVADIGKPKADALREELQRQFPAVRIEAATRDVVPSASFLQAHLILNATGEEAVSEMLNEYHVQRLSKAPTNTAPILHTWIKGAGETVQALWVDSSKLACFRCLKNPTAPPEANERHKVLKSATPEKFVGCKAITPYSVSAPMAAAALAIDMVAAWLQDDPSPRFRTRSVETADVYKVPNKNLDRIKGCPACSSH